MSKKADKYNRLYIQLKELLAKKTNFIAQAATLNAILYHKNHGFFWVGFYLKANKKLIVGPYQGPVACQILKYPKGVCWATIESKKSIIVPNVNEFPEHIACDSRSKSEIVLPIRNSNDEIVAVLDIDSDKHSFFDNEDQKGLERIIQLLTTDFIDQIAIN